MDFREYVRAHVPPLAIAREPEIVDESASRALGSYRRPMAGHARDIALVDVFGRWSITDMLPDLRIAIRSLR